MAIGTVAAANVRRSDVERRLAAGGCPDRYTLLMPPPSCYEPRSHERHLRQAQRFDLLLFLEYSGGHPRRLSCRRRLWQVQQVAPCNLHSAEHPTGYMGLRPNGKEQKEQGTYGRFSSLVPHSTTGPFRGLARLNKKIQACTVRSAALAMHFSSSWRRGTNNRAPSPTLLFGGRRRTELPARRRAHPLWPRVWC